MLYTILITACLVSAPAECRTYEQPATELSAMPVTAYVQAQALVAQWLERHPGKRLGGFVLLPGRGA